MALKPKQSAAGPRGGRGREAAALGGPAGGRRPPGTAVTLAAPAAAPAGPWPGPVTWRPLAAAGRTPDSSQLIPHFWSLHARLDAWGPFSLSTFFILV